MGSQRFSLTLDRLGALRDYRSVTARIERGSDIMELGIPTGSDGKSFPLVWRDQPGNSLERQLTEIAIELIVEGERQYRRSALDRYEWKVERRQVLREEARQRQKALAKANEERRVRREKERIRGLLRQAIDFRKANDIRALVASISSPDESRSIDRSLLEEWANWASAVADKIDPIKNGHLIVHMADTKHDAELTSDGDFDHDD